MLLRDRGFLETQVRDAAASRASKSMSGLLPFLSEHAGPKASEWGSRRLPGRPAPSGAPRRRPRKCSRYAAFPPFLNQCPPVSSPNSIPQH